MLLEMICLALGTAMFVWPQMFARFSQRRHAERLNEIRHGGEEQFFEERRALETYPALANPRMWRVYGGVLALFMIGRLTFLA